MIPEIKKNLNDETTQALFKAWGEQGLCTKIAFFSFIMAKVTFVTTIVAMMTHDEDLIMINFFLYFVFVWSAVFLSVYDWVKNIRKQNANI